MTHQKVVAEWRAQEIAELRWLGATGSVTRGKAAGRPGLEVFEAIFVGDLPAPPAEETLDFVPIPMAPGVAGFPGKPMLRQPSPSGTVLDRWHGHATATWRISDQARP